jgi:hypothetical protein
MSQADKAILWRRGIVGAWYLYDYQLPVYSFLRQVQDAFFEATRRFGKTTTELAIDIEDCLRAKEWIVRWCEPWKEQARNVVIPEMETITASCPASIRPRFYRTDSFYEFPTTGSRIYLLGVNEDRGESARGSKANKVVRDEYGSWRDAKYISTEVLMPLLITTGGQMATLGTPPPDLGHDFYTEKKLAIPQARLIQRDFDTVEEIPASEKERFIQSMGGRQSTAVRRELYLEPVSDPEKLVIPEYNPDIHDLDDDTPRPPFFDAYDGIDLGFNDCTAVLFAYWDFLTATLVIDDELVVSGKNSKEISEAAHAKEKALWSKEPYMRWGDNELQQLHDLSSIHGFHISPTAKDDKLAALNALRLRFQSGRIKIKKRCQSLRYQLKVGLWNDRKSDFQRGEKTGHLDAIDALIYLSRNISENRNPYPQNAGKSIYTHFLPDTGSQGNDKALASVF